MKKFLIFLFFSSVITACGLGYSVSPTPTPTRVMTITPSMTPLQSQVSETPATLSTSMPQIRCPSYGDGPTVYLDEIPAFAVRQGPGCEYEAADPILRKENPIAFFDVLGKQGDWLLVDLCNDQQGWVFAPAIDDMNSLVNPGDLATAPVTHEVSPTTLTPSADSESMEQAKDTLISFYDLLYNKRYDEASKIFSGGYGIVIMWNPNVDRRDYSSLLRTACEFNDFICSLRVARIANEEQVSPMEYHFTVEFIREDGSLYQRPDNRNESVSQFQVRVVKDCNGRYFVVNWPFYRY